MKKFLSLFAAILFAGSMMAADPVEIANGTFNGKSSTYTAGWSTNGTGKSRTDCIIIGANENITSPEVDLSNYESITVQIKARRYGTLSGSKAQIAVTFDGEAIGSTEAAGTSATTALDPIEYTVNNLSTGNFVFTCTNATSAGSSHGAGINSIVITGIEKSGEGGGEQEGTVKTVYCKVTQGWWTAEGAATGIYAYADGNVENAAWPGVRMEAVEGEDGLWKADIDTAVYQNIIFTRFNPSDEGDQDWGAKTGNLQIPADKDLYTITSETAVWGDPGVAGEWSVYVAPVPVENVTIYCVNTNEWETVNAFVWPETGNAYKEWTGEAMTKTENQIHGFDVYSYTFPENYVNIIFNDGTAQTENLTWDAAKPYFYDGKWYESADKIPAPAVPLEGNIWKAIATTPVLAGSHYIDEELIKMDGVYATTLKANTRTIAGEEFTHAIQVRTGSYPTATDLYGTVSDGSTPLVITAKENIEVTFYYNRQAIDASGAENDNKDLVIVDQAAPTVKLTGEFVIDQVLEGNKYLNATKKVMLEKDHVYTATAANTTLQLHGVKFGIPVPHYYIAGTMTDWAAHMVEMEAGNVDTFHVALALEADSLYSFKVVKILGTDTTWYGNEEEGTMEYGNSTGWWLKGQVDVALQTTKAGEYEFIFKANENNEISVVIPEPAKKYYAKYAPKWEWSMLTEKEGMWLTDTIVYGGIGININDKADDESNMFYSNTVEEEGVRPIAGAEIAEKDTIYFSFNPADSVVTAIMVGKYVPQLPVVGLGANFNDWNYGANLLTPAEDSLSASIKVTLGVTDTLKFKIVSDNNWLSLNGEGEDGLYGLHRGWPTAEHINLVNNGRNFALNADVAGEYTFTWFYADSTLTITFPDKPENQLPVVGLGANFNEWNYGENLFVPAEDSLSASIKVTLGVTDTIEFKIVSDGKWLSLPGENGKYLIHRDWNHADHVNQTGEVPNFAFNADAEGEYTFTWTYADSTLTVTFPEKETRLADGYYLIGLSMAVWEVEYITEDYLFTVNPSDANEYMLEVTLAAEQEFKVVKVESDVIKTWYPDGTDNNYFVDANHAGNKTVYFRPNGDGGEGWHYNVIYVAANDATAIDETVAAGKAAKVLRDGQILIIKGEKIFNVQGQRVK